jgi:Zn-dependent membrane protease YugP
MSSSSSDLYFLLVFIVPAVLVWWSQARVQHVFREADQTKNDSHINGYDTARRLLDMAGLTHIPVVVNPGALSSANDAYDPTTKLVMISPKTAQRDSDLSLGVSGHEVGHATQDAEDYPLMRLRTSLAYRLMRISWLGSFAFVGGFLYGIEPLMWVALGIVGLQAAFALVTLPVEIDASKRAMQLLERGHLIAPSGKPRIQRVLRAAAFTYLASAARSVAFFLVCFTVLAAATGLHSPFDNEDGTDTLAQVRLAPIVGCQTAAEHEPAVAEHAPLNPAHPDGETAHESRLLVNREAGPRAVSNSPGSSARGVIEAGHKGPETAL